MTGKLNLYTVGGIVQAGDGIYICRQADESLFELCQEGEFAYILTPRQVGKSSLMVRTAERLEAAGRRTAIIDLTECGVLATPGEWYFGVASMIAGRLGLAPDLLAWWMAHDHYSLARRLFMFFTDIVLPAFQEPITIFVDEIDSTLALDFTDDFFATVRYLYTARALMPELERLAFVLIGVATPTDLIADARRTPFNIGRRIALSDFTLVEAMPLAEGLAHDRELAGRLLRWILEWTGGHPYLTQRLCAVVARQEPPCTTSDEIDRLVAHTFFGDRGEHDSNLQFVRDMLTRRATPPVEILATYRQVLRGRRSVPDDVHSRVKIHLKLSGVVVPADGRLRVRNPIYATVFNDRWVRQQWPQNWWQLIPAHVRLLLALIVVTLVALTFVSLAAVRSSRDAQELAAVAVTREAVAVAAEARAESASVRAAAQAQLANMRLLIAQAQVALVNARPRLALLQALTAIRLGEGVRLTSLPAAETVLRQAMASLSGTSLLGHEGRLWDVAFSPDGRWLISASDDRTARLWAPDDPDPSASSLALAGHGARVRDVAFTGDGRYAITASEDGGVRLWDLQAGDPRANAVLLGRHEGGALAVVVGSTGRWVMSGGADGAVYVWDLLAEPAARAHLTLPGPGGSVWNLALTDDGRWLAAGTRSTTVRVWDLRSSAVNPTYFDLTDHDGQVWALLFSPDGRWLASGNTDGALRVWRTSLLNRTTKPRRIFRGDLAQNALAFSPDSRAIAAGGVGRVIRLWSLSELAGDEPMILEGHEGLIFDLAFTPDGQRLLSASSDHSIRVWSLAVPDPAAAPLILRVHDAAVRDIAISPDGRWLASAGWDGAAHIWNIAGRNFPAPVSPLVVRGHDVSVFDVYFSPDDGLLLTGSIDRAAYAWNLATPAREPAVNLTVAWVANPARDLGASIDPRGNAFWWDLSGPAPTTSPFTAVPTRTLSSAIALGTQGRWLVTLGEDRRVTLFDLASERPEATARKLTEATSRPISAQFSLDGRWLLVILPNHEGLLWPMLSDGPAPTPRLLSGFASPWFARFSPDAHFLVGGGQDRLLHVWDLAGSDSVEPVAILPFDARIWDAAISQDSKWLLVGFGDFRAGLWSLPDLTPEAEPVWLEGHTELVSAVAISPDGHWAATASTDKTVILWNLHDRSPEETGVKLLGHEGMVTTIAFSHDSRWLGSGDRDGAALVWPVDRRILLDLACDAAGRNFTGPERARILGAGAGHVAACPDLP